MQILSFLPCQHCWPLLFFFYSIFGSRNFGRRSHDQQKAEPVGFIFMDTFQLIRMKFGVVLKEFKWYILIWIWNWIFVVKGYNCCFAGIARQLWCWPVMLACTCTLWTEVIQTDSGDRYYIYSLLKVYLFSTSLNDFDLDSRVQENKTSTQIISENSRSVW